MKYNIDYYLPKAVLARRKGLLPPRQPKTDAEKTADDQRFSYDANQGWSHIMLRSSTNSKILASSVKTVSGNACWVMSYHQN
jgi:hypothetical protein